MITIPRKITYQEKCSSNYFFNKSKAKYINEEIYHSIFYEDGLLSDGTYEKDLTSIFNDAYYITSMVFYELEPDLNMIEYFKIASKKENKKRGLVVMAIVLCYLKTLLFENNEQCKLADLFMSSMESQLGDDYHEIKMFYDRIAPLNLVVGVPIFMDEFKPKKIEKSKVAQNWSKITNEFELDRIDKVVKVLGSSKEEKFYIVDYMYHMFKMTANEYYSKKKTKKDIDDILEHLKRLLLFCSEGLKETIIKESYSYDDVFSYDYENLRKNIYTNYKEDINVLKTENNRLNIEVSRLKQIENDAKDVDELKQKILKLEKENSELQNKCNELEFKIQNKGFDAVCSLVQHLIEYAENESKGVAREIKIALDAKMARGWFPYNALSEEWKKRFDALGREKKDPMQNIYNFNKPIGTMVAHTDEINLKHE